MIAPVIELPAIRREGLEVMLNGMSMSLPWAPMGFAFCPYRIGSTERVNFLIGCCAAVFGAQH